MLAAPLYDSAAVDGVEYMRRTIDMVPFAAVGDWPDLYLPRSVLARFPPEDREAEARLYADGSRVYFRSLPDPGPSRAPAPAQGRNEPCRCGSGRKFKRCCGTTA